VRQRTSCGKRGHVKVKKGNGRRILKIRKQRQRRKQKTKKKKKKKKKQ